MTYARKFTLLTVLFFALLSLFAFLLIFPGRTFSTEYVYDLFLHIDWAYRVHTGQMPHLDFQSPLGFLTYAILYLSFVVSGEFGFVLPVATSFAMGILFIFLLYVLPKRLNIISAAIVGTYAMLMMASPMLVGDTLTQITWAMWYNRICWAYFIVLLILFIPSSLEHGHLQILDGAVGGIIVFILFYTKITFGLVAISFIFFLIMFFSRESRSPLIAMAIFLSGVVMVELIWGINSAYLHDVLFTIRASDGGYFENIMRPLRFMPSLVESVVIVLAAGVLYLLSKPRIKDFLFMSFVFVVSVYIAAQNTGDQSLPSVVVILALVVERVRSAYADGSGLLREQRTLSALAFLVIFVSGPIFFRSVALVQHAVAASAGPARPDLPPTLAGFPVGGYASHVKRVTEIATPIADLVEVGNPTPGQAYKILRDYVKKGGIYNLGPEEYLLTLAKGVDVLRAAGIDKEVLFVYDFANPFTFALNLKPIKGDLFNFHSPRQYNRNQYIPPEQFLDDVEICLVPTFPIRYPEKELLLELYGDYLKEHFQVAVETEYWTVWRRRSAT